MQLFKTDMTARDRLMRLVGKLFGTPFLPILGWSKAVEALFTATPLVPSVIAAVLLTVLWVVGEDLHEYLQDSVEDVRKEID